MRRKSVEVDLFRRESAILHSYWVLVAIDHWTRRIVGFGVHRTVVASITCRQLPDVVGPPFTDVGHVTIRHSHGHEADRLEKDQRVARDQRWERRGNTRSSSGAVRGRGSACVRAA